MSAPLSGTCDAGFTAVRDAFADNFAQRGEVGAGVCVQIDGRTVVDLVGGWADEARQQPWQHDTLVNFYSVGKAFVALLALQLVDNGTIGLDDPIATVWPEFAVGGKQEATVRQALCHRAGVPAIRERLTNDDLWQWDRMSTMGYEIAGALGAKMARPDTDVVSFVGDGSYLMMNTDIYSTVFTGNKVIFIVCDNGGFASINNLQVNQGGVSFNNLLHTARHKELARVDFAKHAEALGAIAEHVERLDDLPAAFARAKASDRTYVIVIDVAYDQWTGGGCWWEVGVPEVSDREQVLVARGVYEAESKHQRIGV